MSVQTTQTPRGYTPGNVAQAQDAAVFERAGAGVYLTVEWIATYVQTALGNGSAISFGATNPANTVGAQDDVFFNIATGEVLSKGASTWSVQANFALDTEVTAAITAAITAHTGATDPHPTYLTQAEATALYKPLTTDDSVATGLRFSLKTVQTGTPANGEVQFNNATLVSVTQLLISETGRDGSAIANLLDLLQSTTRIIIQSEQSEGLYAWFNITGAPTDSGTYRTVPVTFVTAPTGVNTVAGLGVAAAELTLDFYGVGGTTSSGGGATGIAYTYSDADPPTTAGQIRTLQADLSVATAISINSTDALGKDASNFLPRLATGAIFQIAKDATNWVRFIVTTAFASNTVSVTVQAFNGAIANTDTVYLSILSDAPSVGGGGGGGTTWTTENTDLTFSAANADVGIISDSTVTMTITMPSGIASARRRSVRGKGVGRWQIKGATFYDAQGNQNTGVRRLTTHQHASVDLFHLGNDIWLIENPVNLTGIELYVGSVDTRLSDYQAAIATAGYTLTAGEITALSNWLTAMDLITPWANVVAFYPFLGGTLARGRINFVAPNNTAHYVLDASNQAAFNAFGVNVQGTGGFDVRLPRDFLAAALTNTRFSTIQASVRALAAPTGNYAIPFRYENSTGHYSLGINGNGVSVAGIDQASAAGFAGHQYGNWNIGTAANTGNYVLRSAANGASNITGTVFKDGSSVGTNTTANILRGTISSTAGEFYILSGGSATGGKMATGSLRSLLIISSTASLSDANCLALSNADVALQNALGRS